jgi:hypothetical protein
MTGTKRNVEHIRKNGRTPIVSPEVDIFTISKKPNGIFKNCTHFIFDATPWKRVYMMLNDFPAPKNSSV